MGKDRAAEARAAEARETARQFDELRKRADKISYDKDEVLENLKIASEQIPELVGLYEAAQKDPSALEDIATNPRFTAIQEGNLEEMQEMAEQGGFSESDKAKRRALQRQVAADDSARQKSIVQDMAMRGQAGSGTELLARLGSSQASAQRAAEASDRLAMDSASARKQALANASQQAGSLRQQDYGEQSNLASARDQISQFNALQRANTANQNLQLRQGQENQRSGQQANYYANAANTEQQRFANEMSKLGMQSNMVGNAGQARMQGVYKKKSPWGAIGTAAGAGLGAYVSGGSPQGTAAGASIGGAVGNIFRDGGIRHKYNIGTQPGQFSNNGRVGNPMVSPESQYSDKFIDMLINKDKQMLNNNQDDILSEGIQKQQAIESDVTRAAPNDGKSIQDARAKTPDTKESPMSGEALGALASIVGQAGQQMKSAPAPALPKYSQEKIAVQSMPGFKVEDGGVKPSIDDMRDQLLGQVQAFAEGGVKYEDGGISKKGIFGDYYKTNRTEEDRLKELWRDHVKEKESDPVRKKLIYLNNRKYKSDAMMGFPEGTPEFDQEFNQYMQELNNKIKEVYKTNPEYAEQDIESYYPIDSYDKYKSDLKKDEEKLEWAAKKGVIWSPRDHEKEFEDYYSSKYPEKEGKDFSYQKREELENKLDSLRDSYEDGGISPELRQAAQSLRTQPAAPGAPMPGGQPPMPPAPMPQEAAPMPPQGMPMPPQGAPMPPQGQPPMPPQGMPPMPPQGQMMADGGMAYEDGGEGTIIDSGMEMYEGDQLPDRINDGEMVLNVEQQDRLNDALMELKRLKSRERTDKMLAKGEIEANPMQQESLMSFVRGEIDIDEVPNERVVKEPSMGEPSGRMAELLGMVSKKRRG